MAVKFDLARSDRSSHEEKHTTRALDPCATSGVAIHFSPLFMDEKKFPKSLIDSGFQDTRKSTGFKPCEGSVHKVIFWVILRYFRKRFPYSTILALLNAIKIIFFLKAIFEKSFKYIVDFLRGKSL
jgi:hypothetical protein